MRIHGPDGVDPMVQASAILGNREMAIARGQLTGLVYGVQTARDRAGWADDPNVVPEEFCEHVEDSTWYGYTTRERLTIQLAENYALNYVDAPESMWDERHVHFTDDELIAAATAREPAPAAQ